MDPITFEVLRHRLWAINDEAATTIRLVSGSPVANEAYDFNTALLDAGGEVFTIGTYIAMHAISLKLVVNDILEGYEENPGIHPDDMYLCNDPYVGALHQSDVTLVAPIHWQGELLAWTGAAIHQIDVGGAGKGQVSVGAQSIFEESAVIPPLKIVEGGTIRRDIEREYLRRSRLPHLLALDLRANIASNHVAKRRILELVERYGLEAVKATMAGITDLTERRLKERLRQIPDGTFRHISYLDYEERIYPCRLELRKEGDHLTLDFRGTARQAPAVINCTYAGLEASVLTVILNYLCYDIPWSPAGVMRAVTILSEPGTVIHAEWPAGVCKATTSASWAVINATSVCLARLLATSDRYRNRLMAPWKGGATVEELFGTDRQGKLYGGTILDFMAGGGGAKNDRDGVDTGGFLSSVSCSIMNVETYELHYPILYLYRRQQGDSGGPGMFRGGVSLSTMYIPHGVEEIPHKIMHAAGVEQPESVGICGGYPASTNQSRLRRNSNILDLFRQGIMPASLEEIDGQLEVPAPIVASHLMAADVYTCMTMGGGGYGDPTLRQPQRVWQDVKNGLISPACARQIYGVVFIDGLGAIDDEGTARQRQQIREERRSWSRHKESVWPQVVTAVGHLSEWLEVVLSDTTTGVEGSQGKYFLRCRCGAILAPLNDNYKLYLGYREDPVQEAGPYINPHRVGGDKFVFRRFCCPHCSILLEAEIALRGAPLLWDAQPQVGNQPEEVHDAVS